MAGDAKFHPFEYACPKKKHVEKIQSCSCVSGAKLPFRKPLETESIFSHVTPQVKSLVLQLLEPDQDVVTLYGVELKKVFDDRLI